MADFSATKHNASLEEWGEALECMVEMNGKSFDITEISKLPTRRTGVWMTFSTKNGGRTNP
ncbi:hypothetical protein SMZ59_003666 [Salmonella enterica]|nr:hypothetical protein [Salmonella enterica]